VRSACALVVELAAFYPARSVFWLGRDMEYHHDVMLLLHASGEVPRPPRLLEVTRESARDPLLPDYCRQQGLEDERAVVVDSGVTGNVITAIHGALPDAEIRGVLLYSESPAYPGSEAAFAPLGGSMQSSPYERRTTLEQAVERLPRFHRKTVRYAVDDGSVSPRRASEPARREWRQQAVDFMTELVGELRRHLDEGGWHAERRAVGQLLDALDAAEGAERRVVVPLAALGPDENELGTDTVYALRDLEGAAEERLKDPHLVLELDPAGASPPLRAAAEHLLERLAPRAPGRVRLTGSARGPSDQQPPEGLNPQQLVAWLWERLDAERRRQAPVGLVAPAVEAVLQLQHGGAWLRDVLEAAARRTTDRALRADALGALWKLVGEAVCESTSAGRAAATAHAAGVSRASRPTSR
jgi:hypothetical protein